MRAIPRLSQAGMPSRSEGWGAAEREPDRAKHQYLFKDEQYQLNQTGRRRTTFRRRSDDIERVINRYCSSLNRPSRLRFAKAPRLTQAGNGSMNFVPQSE